MGKARCLVAALALGFIAPAAAHAQAKADRRIEIGGGMGTVAAWLFGESVGHISGGDLRVTLPVAARGDLEVLGALGRTPDESTETVGFYAGQFRLLFREPASAVQPFMTFGAMGLLAHSAEYGSDLTAPLITFVGAGVQRRLTRHLIVRGDAQSMLLIFVPVGVRVAGGVSIPIGSTR